MIKIELLNGQWFFLYQLQFQVIRIKLRCTLCYTVVLTVHDYLFLHSRSVTRNSFHFQDLAFNWCIYNGNVVENQRPGSWQVSSMIRVNGALCDNILLTVLWTWQIANPWQSRVIYYFAHEAHIDKYSHNTMLYYN